jgi:hypothetical protein
MGSGSTTTSTRRRPTGRFPWSCSSAGRTVAALLAFAAAGCSGGELAKVDASAIPVARAWIAATYVTFDCVRAKTYAVDADATVCKEGARDAARLRDSDRRIVSTAVSHDCKGVASGFGSDADAGSGCIRVVVTGSQCSGKRNGVPYRMQYRTTYLVFLTRGSAGWRVVGDDVSRSSDVGPAKRC